MANSAKSEGKKRGGRIDSANARSKLIASPAPYWHRLSPGCHLGFRKLPQGEGTWIAKWRDPGTGKRFEKSLGAIVDDGRRPYAFERAKKMAEDWFRDLGAGLVAHSLTVADACRQHIDALRRDDGETKAKMEEARFERFVYADALGRVELGKLQPEHVIAWRKRLADLPAKVTRSKKKEEVTRQRSAATINRDMVPLRAALNRALDANLVATDIAWRAPLKPIKNSDRRREIYLDRDDRKSLLDHARDDIRDFLRALALLPLRPGALASLTVADYDQKLRSLRIGTDKAGAERRLTLPESTATFMSGLARGKLPGAPLLSRADGHPWDKDAWKGPVKDAVIEAGLPSGATAYSLRHSVITDLVKGKLDLLTVAQLSGTSVAMIERFYGHLQKDHAAKALATLAI